MRTTSRFEERSVPANQVRIPVPHSGAATIVRRYHDDQAVLLHPDDYRQLVHDAQMMEDLGVTDDPPAATPLERELITQLETPGAEAPLLEDPQALAKWIAQGEAA